MKYIRHSYIGIIAFPPSVNHDWMADKFGRENIISAGFIVRRKDSDDFECTGFSSTLKLGALPDDTETMHSTLNLY